MDTINKLLKKQAPKRRGRAAAGDLAGDATPNTQDIEFEKPNPIVIRWVNNAQGSRIGVPEEWLDTPIGKVFGPAPTGQRKLVEENDTT
jgi:Ino eighty subunit 2